MNKLNLKSEFSRNVLMLLTGTFLAQLIPLGVSPLLTRIYTPYDFGLFAFLLGVTTIFTSVFNGRYDAAILVPKEDMEAHILLRVALYIPLILATFLLIIFFIIPESTLLSLEIKQEAIDLRYFIPVIAILFAYYMGFDVFLNRQKAYKEISYLLTSRIIFVAFFQIIFGFIFKNGLLYGLFFGMMIAIPLGLYYMQKYSTKYNVSIEQIISTVKRYKNYPLFHMPHTLLNALSNNVPMVIIPFFFSLVSSGLYLMTLKVFYTPFSMLGASIEKVFRKKVVDYLHENKKICDLMKTILFKIVLFSFIPYVVLVWFSPVLFSFILGKEWLEVGVYIQILSPWIYMAFIVSIFVGIPIVLEQQKKSLMIEIGYFILRIGGLIIGAIFYDNIYVALVLFSFGGLIVLCYNLYWIYSLAKTTDGKTTD
jgi:O-antigen/teichoic acid export membrane protein